MQQSPLPFENPAHHLIALDTTYRKLPSSGNGKRMLMYTSAHRLTHLSILLTLTLVLASFVTATAQQVAAAPPAVAKASHHLLSSAAAARYMATAGSALASVAASGNALASIGQIAGVQ